MPVYHYPLPPDESRESNGSQSGLWALPARSESRLTLATDCNQLHNATRCGNDLPYFQPLVMPYDPSSGADDDCSDDPLTFRARVDQVFSNGNGVFAFTSDQEGCELSIGQHFVIGELTPTQFAQMYADWVNATYTNGISAQTDGAVIILHIPKSLIPCGCNLRLQYLPLLAEVTILEQPQCCTPPSETCSVPEGFAEMKIIIPSPESYEFGNITKDFAFRLQFAELNCEDVDFSAFDAPMRTALSADYDQYLMRVLTGLQRFLFTNYGRSTVRLEASTGTFTILWDKDFILNHYGINICGKEWTICTFKNSSQTLEVSIDQQPYCCNPLKVPCVNDPNFAEFVLEIKDNPAYIFGDSDNDCVFVVNYTYVPCSGDFFITEPDLWMSNSASFSEYIGKVLAIMNAYFGALGDSYVTQDGNRFHFFLDKIWYQEQNIDICNALLFPCLLQPATQTHLGQWLQVEIIQQPYCCPLVDPCPPKVPEPAYEPIEFLLELPDEWNDPTDPQYGWSFEGEDAEALIDVSITDGCCQILESETGFQLKEAAEKYWVGGTEDGRRVQYLRLNASKIPYTCFGFRFRLRRRCESVDLFSEPFRRTTCLPTLNIETEGGGCQILPQEPDWVVGTFAQPLYNYRIAGTLERTGYEAERETLNGRMIRYTQTEEWTLKTNPLPEYAVQILASLLTRTVIRINGILFEQFSSLKRNNVSGRMWYAELTLRRKGCELKDVCA